MRRTKAQISSKFSILLKKVHLKPMKEAIIIIVVVVINKEIIKTHKLKGILTLVDYTFEIGS